MSAGPIVTIPEPRWPVQPLMDASRAATPNAFAVAVGMSGSTLRRALRDGLSDIQAERYAHRLDLFPHEVWGWDWHQWAIDHLPEPDQLDLWDVA